MPVGMMGLICQRPVGSSGGADRGQQRMAEVVLLGTLEALRRAKPRQPLARAFPDPRQR